MTLRIWKYGLALEDQQDLVMPVGARVLTVQTQHGTPQLWVECDPAFGREVRRFAIYGTGHPLPEQPGLYVGTVLVANDALVFHVYEVSAFELCATGTTAGLVVTATPRPDAPQPGQVATGW